MGTALNTPLYTIGPGTVTEWQGNSLDDSGAAWIVTSEEGWSSSPPARPSQADKTTGDGTWAGRGYYAGRLVNLQGTCVAPDRLSMLWAKEAIKAAFGPWNLVTLQVDEAHLTRTAQVRLSDKVEIQDKGAWAFAWAMGLFAPDPRRYGTPPVRLITTLPPAWTASDAYQAAYPGQYGVSPGGRSYPRSYPMTFGGGSTEATGTVQWVNPGSYAEGAPAVITIYGPVSSPRLDHQQSGCHLEFGVTVPYGQYLVIDLAAQSVMLGGTASRAGTITVDSAWFLLAPGANELRLSGTQGVNPDGTAGTPWMTVDTAPAWA